jgi:hypothetical protein
MEIYFSKLALIISLCLSGLKLQAQAARIAADDIRTGQCGDNITFYFNVTTGELRFNGTGGFWNLNNHTYEQSTFQPRNSIKHVYFSEGITGVCDYQFVRTPIESIELPQSIEYIGQSSFFDCNKLKEITFSQNLDNIGIHALSHCSALKIIRSYVKEPSLVGIDEVSTGVIDYKNIILYVPDESVKKYVFNPFWAKFLNIKPLSTYEQDRLAEQEAERAREEAERAKKVQGVEITSQHRDYVYGETAQLAWKVYPETAENKAVKFISSNQTVASVSYERGLINFISPGVATIFVVTKEGGFADSIDIKVKAHSNTYLSSLTASTPYEPKFNKDILNYTSIVPYKVSEVIVDAEPEDFMASVNIKEYSLNVGNNVIPVTVTAEDGETKKTYNLNVKRLNNDARLRTLSFSQGSLTPGFSREHSDYTLTVSKEDPLITVSGITNDENATVEFPSEFYTKDTTFFIKVVAEDTTFSRLYRIEFM